ncbi:MAG: CshA/CshB family fibrillar adhesin-related protein, partial [Bacilli bacterium]
MSFVYANPGSGPSAGGIGWFDFGSLTLNPGQSATGLTGTLNDGTKVTFDIKSIATSIVPFTANSVPRPFSFFGNIQYSGILGNVALTTPLLASYSNNSTLEISNIVVKDVNGNIITNYTAVIADAESTNNFPQYTEHLTFTTTGGPWNLLSTIGPNPPTISGVGSTSVTITGTNQSSQAAYVLTSTSPSMLTLETFGREAVAIGFATTRVTVKKNI